MCDTLVALAASTEGGRLLFAKNSDRERNEAQWLQYVGRQEHADGAGVKLTYVTIPQARRTNAVLLSRPFWLWGAEMGANEHGLVIGNEAMHATIPAPRARALTGMDLVRLALERADSAEAAVDVIVALLERHGQGGNCGHYSRFYYHNGFIIADPRRAYVLETVGRWWIVEEVADIRAVSNAFGIRDGYSKASAGLLEHAAASGWLRADGRFDFAGSLSDTERDKITYGRGRCARGQALLARHANRLNPSTMMRILRDHGPAAEADEGWEPADTVGRTICMHASHGTRRGQTTGSMVSELRPDGEAVHWVTGTSAPCTSIFKPVVLGAGLPRHGPPPTDRFDPQTLWWRHELLHRRVLESFAGRLAAFSAERDRLEREFIERMAAVLANETPDSPVLREAVELCWRQAEEAESRWLAAISLIEPGAGKGNPGRRSWSRLNQVAGFGGAAS